MFNFSRHSSNNGQNTAIGNIMVEYINLMPENDQSYSFPNDTLKEPVGNSFDMNHYVNQIPAGYRFVKILGGSNVKYFRTNPQVVVIGIAPNVPKRPQFHRPTMSTMSIDYQSITGQHLNSTTVKEQAGTPFSIQPYTQMLPMGYRFAYTKNVPNTYVNGAHMTIVVKPLDNQSHVSQPNHINVGHRQNYRPGNGSFNSNHVNRSNHVQRPNPNPTAQSYRPKYQPHVANQRPHVNRRNQQAHQQSNNMMNHSNQNHDYFNDKVDHRVNQNASPQHANVMERQNKTDQMVKTDDDRELDAIGSILDTIGKGLSQLGYALKHRHSQRPFK